MSIEMRRAIILMLTLSLVASVVSLDDRLYPTLVGDGYYSVHAKLLFLLEGPVTIYLKYAFIFLLYSGISESQGNSCDFVLSRIIRSYIIEFAGFILIATILFFSLPVSGWVIITIYLLVYMGQAAYLQKEYNLHCGSSLISYSLILIAVMSGHILFEAIYSYIVQNMHI